MHKADYSDRRRATALSWIHGQNLLEQQLSDEARVAAVVGLLICDDHGQFSREQLHSALNDPSVLQAAVTLLVEAGES